MNTMNMLNLSLQRLTATVFAALVLLTAASADAPGRVARLSESVGDVQLANEREDWRPISRNYAITAGDNLYVSEGGRAELDVGPVQIWLAGGSNVYFERFDDQSVVARLSQGAMAVRIRAWEQQDSMRIVLQSGEASFLQSGFYVVSAASTYAPGAVSVRAGRAEVFANGTSVMVNRGSNLLLEVNGARFDRYAAGSGSGGFEAWASARDRRYERYATSNSGGVDQWMVGARELEQYGSWDNDYEYGRIWYPTTVVAGWAPYRYGRWSWVQPWGWTWVDDAPWGFAPSHYGRWVRVGNRWAWSPGSYIGRPVYAPALVTFFGGDGWSVNASVGPTYSWVPLGWNEPFVPWYSYTPNYWRQVNRPYVRNIAEAPWRPRNYMHAAIPGAITAVAGAAFISGRPVAQNLVRNIAERDLRNAPPARMGEVLPQFQSQPGRSMGSAVVGATGAPQQQGRRVDPNPVVSMPQIVRERAPGAAVAQAAPFAPNAGVAQPRVWQDPNPVVTRPQVQRPAPVTQNPGLGESAVPMSKDRRERAIQRSEQPHGQAPAEYRVAPQQVNPSAPTAPIERRAVAPQAPTVQRAPSPPVVEQRSMPPAPPQPAPVVEQRRAQEARPAAEPQQREKGRAPVQPQQQ
jgi:hypothetical protein